MFHGSLLIKKKRGRALCPPPLSVLCYSDGFDVVLFLFAEAEDGQDDQDRNQTAADAIHRVDDLLVRLDLCQITAARHTAVHCLGVCNSIQDVVDCLTAIVIIRNIILVEGIACAGGLG